MKVSNGQPVLWPSQNLPIVYNIDQGGLGPFSHEEATELIVSSFMAWQSVPNAVIRFQRGPDLPEDVDSTNVFTYLDGNYRGANPIIFDDDGSIVRSLYGYGAEKNVLGFGGSTLVSQGTITAAQALFNGYAVTELNLSANAVQSTILHEFGHFIGLDHSQLFRHLAYDKVGWNDVFVPIMLPTAADDDSYRTLLSEEDCYALSNLYPASGLSTRTGIIRGVVSRASNELPGVNVIARRIGAVTDHLYTVVSGTYLYNRGVFEFSGLPPGDYLLGIEPIDPFFDGISSVGQYASYSADSSFVHPPPMQSYSSNPQETARSAWTPITVYLGETTEDINIQAQTYDANRDETDAILLSFSTPETGAVPGSGLSAFQYLLVPSGEESGIEIVVTSGNPNNVFELHVSQGTRVISSGTLQQSSHEGIAKVRLGAGSDSPVEADRYFIAIKNSENKDISFLITASIVSGQTPSPTITPTESPAHTPTETPTETPAPTPSQTPTPVPTPTAIEVNPVLGLTAIDEAGGTYPRGAAVHNFDIGISGRDGTIIVPGVYDGYPDSAALGPFLLFSHGFYPIAKDMEFTGERDPSGNGSEGVYFLIGGSLQNIPPVTGRLGAHGGPNLGGIDTDNNPSNNINFGAFHSDIIPVNPIIVDDAIQYEDRLVDIEPAGNGGFYVLDTSGRIYAEGDALEMLDTESPPSTMNPETRAVDLEIYRGRTITLTNSRYSADMIGQGAYVLDLSGVIHRIGETLSIDTSNIPIEDSGSPLFYHDMEWIPNPEGTEWIGLGVLRGDGIIFFAPFEDIDLTPEIETYIRFLNPFGRQDQGFGFDIARGFEIEISDSPIYGKSDTGETIATAGRRIGIFMVDGFGGIHTGGRSTRYVPAFGVTGKDIRFIDGIPAVPFPANIPYFGVDVIEDIEIAPLIDR